MVTNLYDLYNYIVNNYIMAFTIKRRVKHAKMNTRKSHNMSGGSRMREKIIKFEKSSRPEKKYMAFVKNLATDKIRVIHFGASDYEQYKDRTPLKLYAYKNHNSFKRMRNYFNRHSGTTNRKEAIDYEIKKSGGLYNPKILSHIYLW